MRKLFMLWMIQFTQQVVLSSNKRILFQVSKKAEKTSALCVVFPGLETTWTSLNPDTMKIKVFRDSIMASQKEISTVMKNVDLNSILFHLETERSVLNRMVGLTALQVRLKIETYLLNTYHWVTIL